MRLIVDDVLEGEDWGEMAGLSQDIRALETKLRRAAHVEERKADAP